MIQPLEKRKTLTGPEIKMLLEALADDKTTLYICKKESIKAIVTIPSYQPIAPLPKEIVTKLVREYEHYTMNTELADNINSTKMRNDNLKSKVTSYLKDNK